MGLATQIAFRTGQKAVWWKRTGLTGTGAPIFEDPVEISVRWEFRSESYMSADGESRTSLAVVYPDREISPRDLLRLGTLAELNDPLPENWASNSEVHEARRCDKIPNMRGTEYLKVVYL